MKIQYDRVTCGRCGGSGSYSYCEMYGTTCFGCGGSGQQLTPDAKKASNLVKDLKARQTRRLTFELAVGNVVRGLGTVTHVERTEHADAWKTVFEKGQKVGQVVEGYRHLVGFDGAAPAEMGSHQIHELVRSEADVQALIDLAGTLKGCRVVES